MSDKKELNLDEMENVAGGAPKGQEHCLVNSINEGNTQIKDYFTNIPNPSPVDPGVDVNDRNRQLKKILNGEIVDIENTNNGKTTTNS